MRAGADAPVLGDGEEAVRAGKIPSPVVAAVRLGVAVQGVVAIAVGLVGEVVDVDGRCEGGEEEEGEDGGEVVHVEEAGKTVSL